MLKKVDLRSGDFIIFIGDYIDRGPNSKELVQELIELRFAHPHVAFLRGNHEDMLLGSLGYSAIVSDMSTWLYNGGSQTLHSYGLSTDELNRIVGLWDESERRAALMKAFPKEHINFFLDLELYVETEHHFFCHAGVDWMREHLYTDEPCWEKTLVCGHTPLRDIHISEKLICIDTGLHYYGTLSAIDVKSKEVFQVSME
jgi:serine/threonine protein phosphatase 1